MRCGSIVPIAAPRETIDFIRTARNGVARSRVSDVGFILGTNAPGDRVLLAASLTMKPGVYSVSLSATSQTGEERAIQLDITLEAAPIAPIMAATLPVLLLNGSQSRTVLSTPTLVEQGWVVPGDFERIPPAVRADVQSQLVLDDKYASLDTSAGDKSVGAP